MGKKGDETKAFIRNTAKALFAQKGFKEVTMKDICQLTGLSRGGLYRHYDSTHQIFSEIAEEMMTVQKDEFASKIENGVPAVRILEEVLERYRVEMLDSENSLSLAIYEYYSSIPMSDNTALAKQYDNSQAMWSNLIQYGIDTGEFKNVDIRSIIDLLVFSYQGIRMYSKIMPIEEEIPLRIINQIKEILILKRMV